MKGSNQLILCQAEIIEALQYYFKFKLFQSEICPVIKNIYADTVGGQTGSQIYKISLIENKEDNNDN